MNDSNIVNPLINDRLHIYMCHCMGIGFVQFLFPNITISPQNLKSVGLYYGKL